MEARGLSVNVWKTELMISSVVISPVCQGMVSGHGEGEHENDWMILSERQNTIR